jgi:anti-sigma B factor antagonist
MMCRTNAAAREGAGDAMARFEAKTSGEPGRAVVALIGECDLTSKDELASALLAAVEREPLVVVDLGALTFLDSTGLYGLVAAHRAATQYGGRLYVINASGAVANVLNITGVGELLRQPADGSDPARSDV